MGWYGALGSSSEYAGGGGRGGGGNSAAGGGGGSGVGCITVKASSKAVMRAGPKPFRTCASVGNSKFRKKPGFGPPHHLISTPTASCATPSQSGVPVRTIAKPCKERPPCSFN